jgi:hypothetical protein
MFRGLPGNLLKYNPIELVRFIATWVFVVAIMEMYQKPGEWDKTVPGKKGSLKFLGACPSNRRGRALSALSV